MCRLMILEEDSIASVQGKNEGWKSMDSLSRSVDNEVLSGLAIDFCLAGSVEFYCRCPQDKKHLRLQTSHCGFAHQSPVSLSET